MPTDHIDWVAQAIVDYTPDELIHLGDHWDFPSLNGHEKPGSKALEGARFADDVAAGNEAFMRLCKPMEKEEARRAKTKRHWQPTKRFLFGNHEDRADRVAASDPKWLGHVGSQHCQTRDFKVHPFLEIAWVDGLCLHVDHHVLKADLTYCRLGGLKVGDELLAFEEEPRGPRKARRYASATVQAHRISTTHLYAVELSNGQVFKTTACHKWLVRGNSNATGLFWCRTDELRAGFVSPHLFDIWQRHSDYNSGWLGGLLDGEGWLTKPTDKQGGVQVGLAQNPGPTLERAKAILRAKGFLFSERESGNCRALQILGASSEKLRLIAEVGAERLRAKFRPSMLGRLQQPNYEAPVRVISVTSCGRGEIAEVRTSTGTLIVDGHPHHNCYSHYFQSSHSRFAIGGSIDNRLNKIGVSFVQGHEQGKREGARIMASGRTLHGLVAGSCYLHIEDYRGRQGQRHWRGIVVLNEVDNGEYDIMPLSLRYLCKKYEGTSLVNYMRKKYPKGSWEHLT